MNDLTRGELEAMNKDEVVSTALALKKGVVTREESLLQTERALVQARAQALAKYEAGRLLITDLVLPSVVFSTGEAINWFWRWLGSPPATGTQGIISAWVARNFDLLRSVPHLILGLGLSVAARPTLTSGVLHDGLGEGGKALATGGLTRLVDYWTVKRQAAASSDADVQAKLAAMTAQLQQAQAALNKQQAGGR